MSEFKVKVEYPGGTIDVHFVDASNPDAAAAKVKKAHGPCTVIPTKAVRKAA